MDGTLTRRDTFFEIIKYIHGTHRFYAGLLLLSPYLFLYMIGVMSNWKAKEKVLAFFFGGMPYVAFQQKCDRFAMDKLPDLLRSDAMRTLKDLKKLDTDILVVSASAENWLSPWCESLGMTCIATKLEIKDGKLTGKIAGNNCNGTEKVNRIQQSIDLSAYETICCYGDSKGDLPMLKLATHAYYKIFKG